MSAKLWPGRCVDLPTPDVLSIGLTVGASLSGIIQFFAITYPGAAANFVWWGRTFYATTCDGVGCPLKDMPAQGYFGPGVSWRRIRSSSRGVMLMTSLGSFDRGAAEGPVVRHGALVFRAI